MSLHIRSPLTRWRRTAVVGLALGVAAAIGVVASGEAQAATISSTELTSGWALHTATGLADTGGTLSQGGHSTTRWNPGTPPPTALARLGAGNVYPNNFFRTHLPSGPDLTPPNRGVRR